MASTEFGTGKSIIVLAIVVGCFAILWPKIFYPMMQAAFHMTSPKQEHEDALCQFMFENDKESSLFFAKLCGDSITYDDIYTSLCNLKPPYNKLYDIIFEHCNVEVFKFCDSVLSILEGTEDTLDKEIEARKALNECFRTFSQKIYDRQYFKKLFKKIKTDNYVPGERPPHLHPGNAKRGTRHAERMREGRPFPHPSARQPPKPQPKSGGAMSIIMPIYTIGIVVFFLYTVLKLVFNKKQCTDDKKPKIKDFHMDPEYHKYVLRDEYTESPKQETKESTNKIKTEKVEETVLKEDYEIYQLRKRLQEMEATMERIVSHMGAVSDCIASNISANLQSSNIADLTESVTSTVESETMQNELKEINAPTNLNTVSKDDNFKSCADLSPSVESYEIVGNSFPTTPIEEIGLIKIDEIAVSKIDDDDAKSITNKQTLQDNDVSINEKTSFSQPELIETMSFDRESSVASEASSFELLGHSRETRSVSPELSENNGQEEEFVGLGTKMDSIGSIDNISLDHFSSESLSADQCKVSFENLIESNSKNSSDNK